MIKVELGVGVKPTPGFVHHDKWKHADYVDVTHDLQVLPWPWEDHSVRMLLATDVFEHLKLDVQQWLDECWRILIPDGTLSMRLPSFNHPQGYGFRDPTHQRVFHPETFDYWCANAPGTIWQDFGRYYFGETYEKWWWRESVNHEFHDLRFILRKIS